MGMKRMDRLDQMFDKFADRMNDLDDLWQEIQHERNALVRDRQLDG